MPADSEFQSVTVPYPPNPVRLGQSNLTDSRQASLILLSHRVNALGNGSVTSWRQRTNGIEVIGDLSV